MKKLMTIALGLGLALGAVSFAQTPAPAKATKATKAKATKATKAKATKAGKKATDAKKM